MRCNSHCPQEGDNRYPQEHNWQRRAALQVKSLMQLSACARNCAARWRSAGRAAAAAATRLLRQPGRWRSRVLAGATAAPGAASAQQRWQTLLSPQRAASQTTAGQLQRRQNCFLRLCPLLPPLARCLSSACCWSYCWRWGGRATRAPRRCWRPQQPQGTLQRKCEACRGAGEGRGRGAGGRQRCHPRRRLICQLLQALHDLQGGGAGGGACLQALENQIAHLGRALLWHPAGVGLRWGGGWSDQASMRAGERAGCWQAAADAAAPGAPGWRFGSPSLMCAAPPVFQRHPPDVAQLAAHGLLPAADLPEQDPVGVDVRPLAAPLAPQHLRGSPATRAGERAGQQLVSQLVAALAGSSSAAARMMAGSGWQQAAVQSGALPTQAAAVLTRPVCPPRRSHSPGPESWPCPGGKKECKNSSGLI